MNGVIAMNLNSLAVNYKKKLWMLSVKKWEFSLNSKMKDSIMRS